MPKVCYIQLRVHCSFSFTYGNSKKHKIDTFRWPTTYLYQKLLIFFLLNFNQTTIWKFMKTRIILLSEYFFIGPRKIYRLVFRLLSTFVTTPTVEAKDFQYLRPKLRILRKTNYQGLLFLTLHRQFWYFGNFFFGNLKLSI